MKELTSKKTKKVTIITDEVYKELVESGMINRFKVKDKPVKELKNVPPEISKPKTKKKND